MANIVYIYDKSFEGLLSAVFDIYKTKRKPVLITSGEAYQSMLGQTEVYAPTNENHSKRVTKAIKERMGGLAYNKILNAFLSCEEEKDIKIYRYINIGLVIGCKIYDDISHPDILAIEKINKFILNEAHHLKGFTRFSLMDNKVFFARISPKNNVVPLLMPFFTDRFSDQPFLVFDENHGIAGVYDLKQWYLVPTGNINLGDYSSDEKEWQQMWKEFYDNVAIKERINLRLRRNNLPKRFWPNMTELAGSE